MKYHIAGDEFKSKEADEANKISTPYDWLKDTKVLRLLYDVSASILAGQFETAESAMQQIIDLKQGGTDATQLSESDDQ